MFLHRDISKNSCRKFIVRDLETFMFLCRIWKTKTHNCRIPDWHIFNLQRCSNSFTIALIQILHYYWNTSSITILQNKNLSSYKIWTSIVCGVSAVLIIIIIALLIYIMMVLHKLMKPHPQRTQDEAFSIAWVWIQDFLTTNALIFTHGFAEVILRSPCPKGYSKRALYCNKLPMTNGQHKNIHPIKYSYIPRAST